MPRFFKTTLVCSFFLAVHSYAMDNKMAGTYSDKNVFEPKEVVGYALHAQADGSADQTKKYQFSIIESGPNEKGNTPYWLGYIKSV